MEPATILLMRNNVNLSGFSLSWYALHSKVLQQNRLLKSKTKAALHRQ